MARIVVWFMSIMMVAMTLPAAAGAQTVFQDGYAIAPDAYSNLPGVKDPKTLQPKERYNCQSELTFSGHGRGPHRDLFGSRSMPVRGYRCTGSSGFSSFGTGNPVSKDWYPGINPPNVDF